MSKNMNILVVDGFSTMRRIIKNLLHELGHKNVSEADDGNTALPVLMLTAEAKREQIVAAGAELTWQP